MFVAFMFAALAALGARAAEPIQVPRYDDADEYLPSAQQRNKDGVRLLLKQQEGEELFKVLTPRSVLVNVVARVPSDATAAVVFLVGGTSVLSIVNDRLDRSFSFQPRSRDYWWAHQFATFLVDAPSDRLGRAGIEDAQWRAGPQHKADLQAVLERISIRFPGPLVIDGHSNGAVSLATVASLGLPNVRAYVLSSAAHSQRGANIVSGVEYKAPVIIMEHRKDTCPASANWRAESFSQSLKVASRQLIWIDGGSDPISGVCGPFVPAVFSGLRNRLSMF